MSIFSAIKNAIFGQEARAAEAPAAAPKAVPSAKPAVAPPAAAPAAPMQSVDVEAVVEQYVARSGQKLNWRTSIVDLLKALGIDSSLANRKALAEELGFDGDNSDSAAMNVWLHKRVMQKLAENGGKVPASILD
jgi:hypothetical protein